MKKVVIIGGGAAGIFAGLFSSRNAHVTILEKNDKLGRKLFITGKGRCNITSSKDISEFFDYIKGNPDFLYSALYTFTNEDTIKLMEKLGVPLKNERGDRMFPVSDKSSDIINAVENELRNNNVDIKLNSKVTDIVTKENKIEYVKLSSGEKVYGDSFIIATGGLSYPKTGSTGDGYKFAKKLGHKVIEPSPSLVPLEIREDYVKELQGLSLKNVEFKILQGKKAIYDDFGELLFTHFGVSGPIVLSGSRIVHGKKDLLCEIDFKPALKEEELDNRLQRDFQKYINKDFKNSLNDLLPQKLIPVIISLSGVSEEKKVNSITKEERKRLVHLLKHFEMHIKGQRPIDEAIITCGGISTKEIEPNTMASKLIDNLYFAGEVIDVDANTGGFNLQIAISTSYIAGTNAGANA